MTTPQPDKSKSSKNGYEIRAEMLELAAEALQFEYNSKVDKILSTAVRDSTTSQVIDIDIDWPSAPTLEDVLDGAQKLYEFVNQNSNTRSR
jgi:hypothetical protein